MENQIKINLGKKIKKFDYQRIFDNESGVEYYCQFYVRKKEVFFPQDHTKLIEKIKKMLKKNGIKMLKVYFFE